MISLIKKVLVGLIVLPLFILPSCIDDSLDNPCPSDKLVDVRMTVSLPERNVKSVITKAPRTDRDTVKDLNVLIFNSAGTSLQGLYYFDASYTGTTPQPTVTPSLPLMNGGNILTTIHFCNIEPTAKFYLVANYGSKILSSLVPNVTALKNLKETAASGTMEKNCMMYAAATDNGGTQYVLEKKADLIRTMAMVTVAIDGTGLSVTPLPPGATSAEIRIIPKKISLHNVPNSCVLGSDIPNVIPTNTSIVSNGDAAIVTSWDTLTSVNHISVGGHEETAVPLFQFENKQGNKSPSADQIYKTTTDKPNASYLEVEAGYQYYKNGSINKSGTIIYKFCLGSDITTNFDVVRNTQYQVTLQLSGWGGAMEDGHIVADTIRVEEPTPEVGWRVDLTLRDWGFLQDEYNFDTHESYSEIPLLGSSFSIKRISGPENMVKYLTPDGGWDYIKGAANIDISSGVLPLTIMPWKIDPAGDYPTTLPYRELVIQVTHGSDPKQTVTFRQWTPIKILENGNDDLYMERFEENAVLTGDLGNSNLKWGYAGDNLSTTPPSPYGSTYNFVFGRPNIGYINTMYLYGRDSRTLANLGVSVQSTAAQRCLREAGYDLNGIQGKNTSNKTPVELNERAAWFLPSVSELERVIGYSGDPTDPYQYHDPIKTTVDYWSSSAPDASHTNTYYWDHVLAPPTHPTTSITTYIPTRDDLKQVRCVYRPSQDATIQGLPFNGKVWPLYP